MDFDVIRQPGSGERMPKVFERRRLAAQARIRTRRRGVRVDGDDFAEVVAGRDGGEADGGFAFEAPDLEDDAACRCARGGQGEKAGFPLGEEAGGDSDTLPGFSGGVLEVWREWHERRFWLSAVCRCHGPFFRRLAGERAEQYRSDAAVECPPASRPGPSPVVRRS